MRLLQQENVRDGLERKLFSLPYLTTPPPFRCPWNVLTTIYYTNRGFTERNRVVVNNGSCDNLKTVIIGTPKSFSKESPNTCVRGVVLSANRKSLTLYLKALLTFGNAPIVYKDFYILRSEKRRLLYHGKKHKYMR